ncbi:hypothetical protein ZIOFF_041654 [Zingiber officinale]|uniref:YDG domain-containing protein n=1 Tax=Zingiber officinale TaxID=94328 RepID=A0A8J5G7D7_ZINOF|nr:hypothetical protein ZIOFF_041654 [Zingiber officinale]
MIQPSLSLAFDGRERRIISARGTDKDRTVEFLSFPTRFIQPSATVAFVGSREIGSRNSHPLSSLAALAPRRRLTKKRFRSAAGRSKELFLPIPTLLSTGPTLPPIAEHLEEVAASLRLGKLCVDSPTRRELGGGIFTTIHSRFRAFACLATLAYRLQNIVVFGMKFECFAERYAEQAKDRKLEWMAANMPPPNSLLVGESAQSFPALRRRLPPPSRRKKRRHQHPCSEELERGHFGGRFRGYGGGGGVRGGFPNRRSDEADDSWGNDGGGWRGYNGQRRGPNRASDFDQPSRANKVNTWGLGRKHLFLNCLRVEGGICIALWVVAVHLGMMKDREGSIPNDQGRQKLILDPPKRDVTASSLLVHIEADLVHNQTGLEPQEILLHEKGIDWRKIDKDLEHHGVERFETDEEKVLKEEFDEDVLEEKEDNNKIFLETMNHNKISHYAWILFRWEDGDFATQHDENEGALVAYKESSELSSVEGSKEFMITLYPVDPFRRNSSGNGMPDVVACNKVKNVLRPFQSLCRKLGGPIIGSVPGVDVGDEFGYRVELTIVDLHRPFQGGVDAIKKAGISGATSIVAPGGYNNDMDSTNVLIYSGSGGNPAGPDKPREDQRLERRNLALKNSIDTMTPAQLFMDQRK